MPRRGLGAGELQLWSFCNSKMRNLTLCYSSLFKHSRITEEADGLLPSGRRKEFEIPSLKNVARIFLAPILDKKKAFGALHSSLGSAADTACSESHHTLLSRGTGSSPKPCVVVFWLTVICSKVKRGFANSPCSRVAGLGGERKEGT